MKRGKFNTALQRRHARLALRFISGSAGAITQGQYKRAYDEAIEAQKHLIVVFGIADEADYFPTAAKKQ